MRARAHRLPLQCGRRRGPAHRGRSAYRSFVEDAARLVAGYGGSLSGEHGDGRARSELLPFMYSPASSSCSAG
ncbi:FAD-linked oxidase C-terminal domain-containing protein [Blastococcus brunescens]|uniref:FAD-linked oxidase C-terminal domain-containing protein n=1 Tax=Blastococcus brunescens TaxID=1564165 RepID=A0ABZ1BAC5_9ACTN|nr:FAD-linked oxidase C-terminal domain-containing protein [Blastococcus sp. BMG 8361]WRL67028.1 FAD-linked oxidase C-terminal domain-containing protein [Blastococcus sp. BMG 8361]